MSVTKIFYNKYKKKIDFFQNQIFERSLIKHNRVYCGAGGNRTLVRISKNNIFYMLSNYLLSG